MDFFVKVFHSQILGYAQNLIRRAVREMNVVVIRMKHNVVEVNQSIEKDVIGGKELKRIIKQK
jgi:hypothetical protein